MAVYKPIASADDARIGIGEPSISLADTTIRLGYREEERWTGIIRFDNVTGGTVISSKVTLQAAENDTATSVNVRIKGELADDPATFSTYANWVGRSKTTAYVDWTIDSWTADSDYDSPSLNTILQEIFDNANWDNGDHVSLFIEDNSSSVDAHRVFKSYDASDTLCARLTIETESGSSSESPSVSPSLSPSASISPSVSPSLSPSSSVSPSTSPSLSPSASVSPSISPSLSPSASVSPSLSPSSSPSLSPSPSPSLSPSASLSPSRSPSTSPSISPSSSPSLSPSPSPSVSPSKSPSSSPSLSPSPSPSASPSPLIEGEFVEPIMVMSGTSLHRTQSSGEFVFPIITMVAGTPRHSRGTFAMPLEIIEGNGRVSAITDIYRGVVMNLNNQAMSTYSNYPYNSLAYFNGKYLGMRSNGIYELSGDRDGTTQILSRIKSGPIDFGTGLTKYIRDVWITFRTDGHIALVFSIDEDNTTEVEEFTKKASVELREEKIKVPRGLRGRYYTIELKNRSGADFDIDSMSVLVDVIGRKR